jgi:hypothetical protein
MKKLIHLLIMISLVLVLPAAASAACTQTLFAGQHIDVGTVTFADDGTVTYATKTGWVLTETHLHVATSLSGIPQTRKGNPKPGKFDYKRYYDPGVTSDSYTTGPWSCGQTLYIAAHAVVEGASSGSLSTITVVSDTTTQVVAGNVSVPAAAVAAWEPYDDAQEPDLSVWDEQTGNVFAGSGADWIWETYRPVDPVGGDIVEFQKTFNIPGTPVSGSLMITCDNGYEAKLNGSLVGSAQLFGNWWIPVVCDDGTSFLRDPQFDNGTVLLPGVERSEWRSVETIDVTSKLVSGGNNLEITGVNEAMQDGIICGYEDQGFDGTVEDNPAGLIYKLDITYSTEGGEGEETAWAAGNGFPGNSWATYFECTVQCQ